MGGDVEEEVVPQGGSRGRHLKKRTLKNKALAVGFDEKNLRDYVTGFHKRKKKRRKEAQRKQEEAERRKRIELRKKRKLERELVLHGGVLPSTDLEADENEEDREQVESVAETKTYENDDLKVTVITSEIGHEEETYPSERKVVAAVSQPVGADKKRSIPIKNKKPFKKVSKHKAQPNPKRGKKKGKKLNKKSR